MRFSCPSPIHSGSANRARHQPAGRRRLSIAFIASVLLAGISISRLDADHTIYDDALQNGWENWSWAETDLNATTPARGTKSIQVTAEAFEALYFNHAPLDPSPYESFSFWLHLGTTVFSPASIAVQAVMEGGAEGPAITLTAEEFPANTTSWKQAVIPLASLGIPAGTNITGFYIRSFTNSALPTFYVDDVSLLEPDAPGDPQALSLTAVVSDHGLPSRLVNWIDGLGKPRSAVMVDQRPQGTGYLRQLTYEVDGVMRLCRGTGANGHQGDGYVQNHRAHGGGSSSHGTGGTTTVVFAGPHHAILAFEMPGYTIRDGDNVPQTVPTSVQWFFANGRSHPLFALSQDARALDGNLGADSRSPYGDIDYTAGSGAPAGGASFGDTHKFVTLAANPEQVTRATGWRYDQANSIPYAMQWADPAQVDAEMGHVGTLPIQIRDQGSDTRTPRPVIDNRGTQDLDGPMIHDDSWAYQILNYVLENAGPTWSRRLTWGTNWGLPGGFDNYGANNNSLNIRQYSQHATSNNGAFNGDRVDGMLMAYSVFVALGPHGGGYLDGTVGRLVTQMENAAAANLTAALGTVVTTGPTGIGNASGTSMAYAPAGYNPTYATWDINADGNALDATLTPAQGKPLDRPIFVLHGFNLGKLPASIVAGDGFITPNVDYFASVDTANQRLWITVNRLVTTPLRLLVTPAGDTTPPTIVSATASSTFDRITINFSEALDPATATDLANYSISPSLAITAAAYDQNVVTLTTAPQAPGGTAYTVAVTGVRDTSNNEVPAESSVTVFSYMLLTDGMLKFSYWSGITGTAVNGLLGDPRYPESPDWFGPVFSLNSRDILPTDANNNYGATMEGYIIPAESGDYDFFLRSDDASELWISTDATEGNLVYQAFETGCCNPFLEPSPTTTQTTPVPVSLVAGQRYFIQVIYKKGGGGGGGYAQVAWRRVGDRTRIAALLPIPGQFLAADRTLPAPAEGAFVTRTPGPNDVNVSPAVEVTISHRDGASQWTADNVSLEFDGVAVTPTFTKARNLATITYKPSFLLPSQSTHTITLGYPDPSGQPATIEWSFETAEYKAPALVFWLDFNDTSNPTVAVDRIGGSDAAVNNGPVYTAGRSGQAGDSAMDFGMGGALQHLDVQDVSFLNEGAAIDQLSVSFWQRLHAVANSSAFWATSTATYRGAQAHTPWSDNTVYFDTAGCCVAGAQRINASRQVDYTEWHHFAFVKNGPLKQVWLDGTLLVEKTNSDPLPTEFTQLFIGSQPSLGNNLQGILDDFAVYALALNQGQIEQLAAGTAPNELRLSYDEWAPTRFNTAQLADETISGRNADPDFDNIDNLFEFIYGFDPLTSNGGHPIEFQLVPNGNPGEQVPRFEIAIAPDVSGFRLEIDSLDLTQTPRVAALLATQRDLDAPVTTISLQGLVPVTIRGVFQVRIVELQGNP